MRQSYHISCLGPRDGEFHVGIFFPVSEQQGELGEETIVDIASGRDGLGVGVAVNSTFQALAGADQFLPCLEVVGVVSL